MAEDIKTILTGAGVGITFGFTKYWDHFVSEVSIKIIDGVIITCFTTAAGALTMFFITTIINRYIKK